MSSISTLRKSELHPEVISRLIQRLMAFYGTKFREAYSNVALEQLERIWSEELSGYSIAELAKGIDGCRALKWPPTLPEFMSLCRTPMHAESAFHEAVESFRLRANGEAVQWTHPAIYHAAVFVGMFDMRRLPYASISARWESALAKQLARGAWEEIPAAPVALIAAPTGATPMSPEMKEKMAALVARMRSKKLGEAA